MTHYMKLNHTPFVLITKGCKTIELRLYDEKRQRIQYGDTIEFTDNTTGASMMVKVIAMHCFDSFDDLYKALPLEKCGYAPEEIGTASPRDMEEYYPPEKQQKYGVVGIEIEMI